MTRVGRFVWLGHVLSENGPSSPSAKLTSCALFNHMDREGSGATVSERTLALETGLARSTVQAALSQLLTDGWVLRREKGRGQYGKPTYVHEATIPEQHEGCGRPASIGPTAGPKRNRANGPTIGPIVRHHNGPIDENHWPDSSQSLARQPGHNHSETYKKPVVAAARPEARFDDQKPNNPEQARENAAWRNAIREAEAIRFRQPLPHESVGGYTTAILFAKVGGKRNGA